MLKQIRLIQRYPRNFWRDREGTNDVRMADLLVEMWNRDQDVAVCHHTLATTKDSSETEDDNPRCFSGVHYKVYTGSSHHMINYKIRETTAQYRVSQWRLLFLYQRINYIMILISQFLTNILILLTFWSRNYFFLNLAHLYIKCE